MDRCLGALIQDKRVINVRDVSALALGRAISREAGGASNWTAEIGVPIEGVPIDGGAEAQKRFFEKIVDQFEIDWSQERTLSIATQTLGSGAVAASGRASRASSNLAFE